MAKSAKTNSSSVVEEQQRQVRYLESENLQLHQELKSLKKDLASAKANAMSAAVASDIASGGTSSLGGDDTIDLGGISRELCNKCSRMSLAERRTRWSFV